jgi:Right handed beta helix region
MRKSLTATIVGSCSAASRIVRPLAFRLGTVMLLGLLLISTQQAPDTKLAAEIGLYVDGTSRNGRCSDTRDRQAALRPTTPICTLSRAAAVAEPGDVVHIAAATYRGPLAPLESGTMAAPISFVADGPDVVIDAEGRRTGIKIIGRNDLRFTGITVTGATTQGIWVDSSKRITFASMIVRENQAPGVQLRRSTDVAILQSKIVGNLGVGIQELGLVNNSRLMANMISGNGWDGRPYNGDGVQLAGVGAVVKGNTVNSNGDNSKFEHGLYAGAARGYLIEDNAFSNNAAADIKAQGGGTIRYNILGTATMGVYVDRNSEQGVELYYNVVNGFFQHGLFLGHNAKANVWNNTLVNQTTISTGQPTAMFVKAAIKLDMRNNLLVSRVTRGRAIAVPEVNDVREFSANANWYAATNATLPMVWGSVSITLGQWKQRTGQDETSLASTPPILNSDGRVASENLGSGQGDGLGLTQDIGHNPVPHRGPGIGAYQG